jgi:hypothetical protein
MGAIQQQVVAFGCLTLAFNIGHGISCGATMERESSDVPPAGAPQLSFAA